MPDRLPWQKAAAKLPHERTIEDRKALVEQFQHLPRRLINNVPLNLRRWHNDDENLIGEGVLALHDAARMYDPRRSGDQGRRALFATYAWWCVYNRMVRYAQTDSGLIHVPSTRWKDGVGICQAKQRARRVLRCADLPEYLTLLAPDTPRLYEPDEIDQLHEALAKLPLVYQETLRLRFLESRTLAETGVQLGITKEAVRQRQVKAVLILRRLLRRKEGRHA